MLHRYVNWTALNLLVRGTPPRDSVIMKECKFTSLYKISKVLDLRGTRLMRTLHQTQNMKGDPRRQNYTNKQAKYNRFSFRFGINWSDKMPTRAEDQLPLFLHVFGLFILARPMCQTIVVCAHDEASKACVVSSQSAALTTSSHCMLAPAPSNNNSRHWPPTLPPSTLYQSGQLD